MFDKDAWNSAHASPCSRSGMGVNFLLSQTQTWRPRRLYVGHWLLSRNCKWDVPTRKRRKKKTWKSLLFYLTLLFPLLHRAHIKWYDLMEDEIVCSLLLLSRSFRNFMFFSSIIYMKLDHRTLHLIIRFTIRSHTLLSRNFTAGW